MAYLDHAAAALPSAAQLDGVSSDMRKLRLANPHSRHPSSKYTSDLVERARSRVLRHFNSTCEEYAVVFTANATHSLEIVADCFNFGEQISTECQILGSLENAPPGLFAYMRDSHTSVVGMREVVRGRCSGVCVCRVEDLVRLPAETPLDDAPELPRRNDLFVVTAMSNFCGRKYPLSVIDKVHNWRSGRSFVCLDAASWVSTSFLDLSLYKPDFVALSFYKMFGFPTGLGALLVRRAACELLQKRYFGGGTVLLAVPDRFDVHRRTEFTQRFEDGTINYWAIAALEHGFNDLEAFGGIRAIEASTMALARRTVKILQEARHANGEPVACIYGAAERVLDGDSQGPIVAFNLLRDDGSYIGYAGVERMCELFGIELRTGCFCNQGACQEYLRISQENLLSNFQKGKVCGDNVDVVDGHPVGAVRVSFGRQSTDKDVDLFEEMLSTCFISTLHPEPNVPLPQEAAAAASLTDIFIYPVKSCSAVAAQEWPISSTGLKLDRSWAVVSKEGSTVSQGRLPALCRIQPEVQSDRLSLSFKGGDGNNVRIPLAASPNAVAEEQRVCSDRVRTVDCGEEVAAWLCANLREDGYRLCQIIIDTESPRSCSLAGGDDKPLSLSNEAPYLMVNRRSVAELATLVGLSTDEAVKRFRANLVIDGAPPFAEDSFSHIAIGGVHFKVVGKCTRCQIICVDQDTGEKDPTLLVALKDFRLNSKATFGVYLKHADGSEDSVLRVGMPLTVISQEE